MSANGENKGTKAAHRYPVSLFCSKGFFFTRLPEDSLTIGNRSTKTHANELKR
jgi:hypothetical protein